MGEILFGVMKVGYASIEVVPPGPTPTLIQDKAKNLSLLGTGNFGAIGRGGTMMERALEG